MKKVFEFIKKHIVKITGITVCFCMIFMFVSSNTSLFEYEQTNRDNDTKITEVQNKDKTEKNISNKNSIDDLKSDFTIDLLGTLGEDSSKEARKVLHEFLLKDVKNPITRKNLEKQGIDRYTAFFYDLDDDGVNEVIGSPNYLDFEFYHIFILKKTEDGYKDISTLEAHGYIPFEILNNKQTNGFKDIAYDISRWRHFTDYLRYEKDSDGNFLYIPTVESHKCDKNVDKYADYNVMYKIKREFDFKSNEEASKIYFLHLIENDDLGESSCLRERGVDGVGAAFIDLNDDGIQEIIAPYARACFGMYEDRMNILQKKGDEYVNIGDICSGNGKMYILEDKQNGFHSIKTYCGRWAVGEKGYVTKFNGERY